MSMRIGEVAVGAAVNVQTLRYYERVGLLPAPQRRPSGYRSYDAETVRRVRFIRRAQALGFTLAEIGDLLDLRAQSESSCTRVEARAAVTLDRIAEKIRDLETIREALGEYVDACRARRSLAECPLLGALDQTDESSP